MWRSEALCSTTLSRMSAKSKFIATPLIGIATAMP
jgi:hypothetical protein